MFDAFENIEIITRNVLNHEEIDMNAETLNFVSLWLIEMSNAKNDCFE